MKLDVEYVGEIPEGWTPLEAVTLIKCLDAEGRVAGFQTFTEGMGDFEAAGMLLWALDLTRRGLRAITDEG